MRGVFTVYTLFTRPSDIKFLKLVVKTDTLFYPGVWWCRIFNPSGNDRNKADITGKMELNKPGGHKGNNPEARRYSVIIQEILENKTMAQKTRIGVRKKFGTFVVVSTYHWNRNSRYGTLHASRNRQYGS